MTQSRLRAIPAVEKVLQALGDTELPRPVVLGAVRRELSALRKQKSIPAFDAVLASVRDALRDLRASRIRPLINGTGILIHTNFGRAPLGHGVIQALTSIGSNYINLEYDLGGGSRGGRAAYLEQGLAALCAAEAATVVNNNAAALVLILRHFCRADAEVTEHTARGRSRQSALHKNEVIISRGELIQIGGGFRIPDILESSGARLLEVGTTNKTSLQDYSRAIGRETALILKVHRSNFFMDGFVETAPAEEIAALARKKRVPFVEDLGSGAMIETQTAAGLEHEPTPGEVIGRGVDLVCFSGDKLLGGPQAGVIAGKANLIAALKRDPFFRALRCDKLILSALEATVDIYMRGEQGMPVLEMLHASNDELHSRAEKIKFALEGLPVQASVGEGQAQIGGGTLPRSAIASVTLDLAHHTIRPQEFAARLRDHTVPVIGYVGHGSVKLDLRTIFPRQDAELIAAIRAACR
ncbi:MAG TPA: L-seryl-tRNA(Sec) selenium transferase [Candidatus Acidoferrales bacterium]|jgi:L-seryl-tRNA(Ser) seleniumtransferase|nr:L-seryl-tRNA(Sec) selenium transferase [Candidatus Acidoferrales bacterium]